MSALRALDEPAGPVDGVRSATRYARASLFAAAVPALAAGLLVLALAGVGRSIWVVQIASMSLCAAFALLIPAPREASPSARGPYLVAAIALVMLAAPLLGGDPGPERWLRIGPFGLYVAPLVLPSLIAACAARIGRGDRLALVAPAAAGFLIALQPDASQGLALLAATLVLCATARVTGRSAVAAVGALVLCAAWAFSRPDPLRPVPYVEGVFALAFSHSILAGAAVLAGAAILVMGLGFGARRQVSWAAPLAVYYGVLFGCSWAGITPAPLIGYGAGPVLGFGLVLAVGSWLAPPSVKRWSGVCKEI